MITLGVAFMNYTLNHSVCGFLLECWRKWDIVKNGSCKLYFSNIHKYVSIADLWLSDFFLHLICFYEEVAELELAKVLW